MHKNDFLNFLYTLSSDTNMLFEKRFSDPYWDLVLVICSKTTSAIITK